MEKKRNTVAKWSLLVAGVWLALAVASIRSLPAAWAEVRDPKGIAVVVGNRNYRNERVPEVSYAHRDATAFRHYVVEVLGYDPDNVIDLRDADQATLESVFGNERSHEGRLWRYLDPEGGSDVVVFYSGHGVPGLKDKRSYLLPVNADPDTAEINGYPLDVLYKNLSKLEEARSVRVFLDACFSGDSDRGMLVRAASPVFVRAELPEAMKKLTVLTAASGQQLASWDEKAEHGLFTHYLMEALYGKADRDGDGKVTAGEAKRYLDRHMTRAARRTFGRHQNANLSGNETVVLTVALEGGFATRPVFKPGVVTPELTAQDSASPPADHATAEQALGLKREAKLLIQRGLASLKFDSGPADGLFGKKTRGAIKAWQRAKGFRATGHLTAEQAEALKAVGEESTREQVAGAKAGKGRGKTPAAKDDPAREAEKNKKAEDEADAMARDGGVRPVDTPTEEPGAMSADSSVRTKVEELLSMALAAAERVGRGLAVSIYSEVAKVQAEAGDTEGAARSISIATSHAESADSDSRDSDFGVIAGALAMMGDFREAERIVEKLRDDSRCFGLLGLAWARAARKDSQGASRSLLAATNCVDNLSDDAWLKAALFSMIANQQADGGDTMGANLSISKALSAAQGIPGGSASYVFVDIAEAQAKAGDDQGAAQSISRALAVPINRTARIHILYDIVKMYARLGNHKSARSMISRAKSLAEGLSGDEAYAWGHIASAQAEIGDIDGAMRAAARATDRDGAFFSIAVAQGKVGDTQAGMRSAEKITSNFLRGAVYLDIARHLLSEGISK